METNVEQTNTLELLKYIVILPKFLIFNLIFNFMLFNVRYINLILTLIKILLNMMSCECK
jgi:hypothetical protein